MNSIRPIFTLAITAALLMISCGGTSSSKGSNTTPAKESTREHKLVIAKMYDYNIVAEYPHSTRSYTQGLQ